MSVENVILKILDARARGLDDKSTANEAGVSVFVATSYEKITRRAIKDTISNGASTLEEIARRVHLPRVTVRRFMSQYGISLPEKTAPRKPSIPKGTEIREETPRPVNWSQYRLVQIREAISSGAASLDEIAQKVGLAPGTVRGYAYQNGIELPSWRDAKRKEKITRIQEAIYEGAVSVRDIGRRIGISESSVLYCAKIDGFPLVKKIRVNRVQKKADLQAEQIRQAVADGALSTADVSRRTGLSYSIVRAYAQKSGIIITNPKAKRAVKKEIVQKALQEGVKSLEELCRRSGFKPSGFRLFCQKNDIVLPSGLVPYKYKPEIDKLVDSGHDLETMAKEAGLSREAVRTYLLYSGQHNLWVNAKERKESESAELQRVRTSLVSFLTAKWVNSVRNQSWPYQKAIDYMTNHPGNRIPLRKLVLLFRRYEDAASEGKKLSLEELSKGLGMWYSHTSQVLENAGLEPMYGTNVRSSPASKEQVSTMKRGLKLGMTSADIGYFLGLPGHVVSHRFAGKKSRGRPLAIPVHRGSWLSYRLASQIYEAQDAGFTREETVELLDTNIGMVDFALSLRKTFEPKIIKKLSVLYNSDMNKPYKS